MKNGIAVSIERSFEKRIAYSTIQYCNTEEHIQQFLAITHYLRKNITHNTKQKIITALEKRDIPVALSHLFKEYYDPLYSHYLDTFTYAQHINSDDIDKAVTQLTLFMETLT